MSEALIERRYQQAAMETASLYLPGLIGDDIETAIADPRTIADPSCGTPIAVPLECNSWYAGSESYFTQQVGCDPQQLYYYAGFTGVDKKDVLESVLASVRNRRGVLVFESSHERPNLSLFDGLLPDNYCIQHLHTKGVTPAGKERVLYPAQYIYIERYSGGEAENGAQDVPQILARGSIAADREGVRLLGTLERAHVDEIYEGYKAAFADVEEHSPISWTLSQDHFNDIMASDQHLKFVVPAVGGGVLGMCVVSNVEELEWYNQRNLKAYIQGRFQIDNAEVPYVACPLIYSRIDAPKALSRKLFRAVAKAFAAAGTDPVCVIECIDPNADAVTRLLELGTKNAGVSALTVGAPVVRQLVSVLCPK